MRIILNETKGMKLLEWRGSEMTVRRSRERNPAKGGTVRTGPENLSLLKQEGWSRLTTFAANTLKIGRDNHQPIREARRGI